MSETPLRRAYVGVGSNLGDALTEVRTALADLAIVPGIRLAAASRLYGNPPMGPPSQPDYVNAVAALDTTLAPHALLAALQAVEHAHGRVRGGERWGPRTLDLDLLLYADSVIDDAVLRVPHPGIAERAFVLVPLAEVAPASLDVPGRGSLAALLAACDDSALRVVGCAA